MHKVQPKSSKMMNKTCFVCHEPVDSAEAHYPHEPECPGHNCDCDLAAHPDCCPCNACQVTAVGMYTMADDESYWTANTPQQALIGYLTQHAETYPVCAAFLEFLRSKDAKLAEGFGGQ